MLSPSSILEVEDSLTAEPLSFLLLDHPLLGLLEGTPFAVELGSIVLFQVLSLFNSVVERNLSLSQLLFSA